MKQEYEESEYGRSFKKFGFKEEENDKELEG